MTCSARSFGCSTSSAASRLSCCSSRPRRRVPAIGRLITRPSRSCTIGSGDEPTIVASAWRRKYMYGDGFTSRSTRYTENGSTGSIEIEALREHDLEDVAVEDVLLRGVDRLRPTCRRLEVAAQLGQLGRARRPAGARAGTAAAGRSRRPRGRAAAPRRRTARASSPIVGAGRRIHVLDQVAALPEVVERGDLTREREHRVGVARGRRSGTFGRRSISRTVS